MSYNSKYTGAEVEALLDAANGKQDAIEDLDVIRAGAAKGATALQSVPADYVTESELTNKGYATISALNDKVDKVSGKQLSTEDFTTNLKSKLEGLMNYNDTEVYNAINGLQAQINTLIEGNVSEAIESFNEIMAFLDGIKDTEDLAGIIASIEQQIADKMDKVTLATVATSGSYDDLSDKPTIPSAVTESTVSGWGFTKNTGTYSKPSTGIPKTDLASAVQTSLGKADTALQSYTEQYKGTVTGVTFYGTKYDADSSGIVQMGYPDVGAVREITVNGSTKTPTNGVVDLGTVLTQHQDISQKADLSNGKILASQLPDYILGQVMYGGIINSGDANNIVVQPSVNYKTKYTLEGSTVTINKYQFWSQQGVYFISGANGTFFDIEVKVGDWLISTGSSVAKVDNTDAVSSIAGLTGVIDASALGKELSYNDLKDKPTIPAAVTESTVSGWGFTKNTGTYSKPSGGIPKTDLASAVQTSLGKADTALQSYTEQYKGTITGVSANGTSVATSGVANIPAASTSAYGVTKLSSATNSTSTSLAATASAVKAAYDLANSYKGTVTSVKINGATKSPSSGVVDLGTVITDISGKQDKLVSGTNIKTINGTSILGSGDITISGGSGSGGGSAAYPEVHHGTSDTVFTLTPNTFHVWDEVQGLDLNFGDPIEGIVNEYIFQFSSPYSKATTLWIPGGILWPASGDLIIEEGKTYIISIVNKFGVFAEYPLPLSGTDPA